MDIKEVVKELSESLGRKKVSTLVLLWLDDNGEHIITTGNPFAAMGLMGYSINLLEQQIYQRQNASSLILPDGAMPTPGHG